MNKKWSGIVVKALIFTNEQEIASARQEFIPNVPNIIPLKVGNLINLYHKSLFGISDGLY